MIRLLVAFAFLQISVEADEKRELLDKKLPNTPIIQQIKYPELPPDVPNVKKLIDLSNLVIEKFNADEMENVFELIGKRWNDEAKHKYDIDIHGKTWGGVPVKYPPAIVYTKKANGEMELNTFGIIFARYPKSGGGANLWIISLIHLQDGKVTSIASDIFSDTDDNIVYMSFSKDAIEFCSFGKKDRKLPYVKWDSTGKIKEQGEQTLAAGDYDYDALLIKGELKKKKRDPVQK